MMRLILIVGFMCLASCMPKRSEPRVVELPELPKNYVRPLPEDCKWKQKEIGVFNQPHQSISFRYQDCPARSNNVSDFYYKNIQNGGAIFTKYKKRNAQIYKQDITAANNVVDNNWSEDVKIHIWKQGPSTPTDFFGSLIMEADYSCEIYPVVDNQYFVVRSDFRNKSDFEIITDEPYAEFMARYNMYEAINSDGWNNRSDCNGFNQRLLVFKGGLVFSFKEASASNIDLSSITYTNRG